MYPSENSTEFNSYLKSDEQQYYSTATSDQSAYNGTINNQYFNNSYSNYYDQNQQYAFNNYNQNYYQYYQATNSSPQFNSYQYQYPSITSTSPVTTDASTNQQSYSTSYINYPVAPKPSTPTPSSALQYTQSSDSTPEKPVMNDSGIDLISPQIANQFLSSMNNQTRTNVYTPTINNLQQGTITQSNKSNDSQYYSNLTSSSVNTVKDVKEQIENDSDDDESIDEQEDDSNLSNKENENDESSKSKSSKSSKSSSANPAKPPKPYLEIIADAILSCNVKMMQLHEIYNFMEKKYQYFAKNINKSWRNSVRHNLSLNECFVKAGRGSNGKGNYWKIHPLCEKEFIRGNFRRKSFKQMIRAGSSNQNNYSATNGVNYSLPSDYQLNYHSISSLIPPPMPQQLNNNSSLASFQYPLFSQEQLASFNQQYSESSTKNSDSKSSQRYHPYRA